MPLYLGLDASTQHLTLQALEVEFESPRLVFEHTTNFDRDLGRYATRHGILPSEDPRVAVAPPLMWADALDRAFSVLAESDLDLSEVAAISGSAQQHGSVYLNGSASTTLAALTSSRPLVEQIGGIFSRETSPVWLDTSTAEECREITSALGGAAEVARLTGSRAFERFTGAQIRRFSKMQPAAYARTARIHLVSSFLASLLAGADAPLDRGDASGMNLMDLARGVWAPAALAATAHDLPAKLPPIAPSSTSAGVLGPYWRERYGLPPAKVVVWSGDNPCSLIGTGLVDEGRIGISLGTSDTLFGLMRVARVDSSGTGHVFGAPTGEFMGLTVFSNGSLARERVRDEHDLDWRGFSSALAATPPGNGGALVLPWFEPEITPHVPEPAVRRRQLDPGDAARNVRAVVEAQMMAMANHSQWMNVTVHTIHATGGASANREILQVMADVFGVDVYQCPVGNSACLGAALRAWHADTLVRGRELPWATIVREMAAPITASRVTPRTEHGQMYARLRSEYAAFERDEIALLAHPQ